jgi:hypothetical protein
MTLVLSSSNLFQGLCHICQYFVNYVGIWLEGWELPHLTDQFVHFPPSFPASLAAFHFSVLLSSFLVRSFEERKWSPTLPLPSCISSQQLMSWATIVNQVTMAPSVGYAQTGLRMNPNSWV